MIIWLAPKTPLQRGLWDDVAHLRMVFRKGWRDEIESNRVGGGRFGGSRFEPYCL
jgi:hypothetical protein